MKTFSFDKTRFMYGYSGEYCGEKLIPDSKKRKFSLGDVFDDLFFGYKNAPIFQISNGTENDERNKAKIRADIVKKLIEGIYVLKYKNTDRDHDEKYELQPYNELFGRENKNNKIGNGIITSFRKDPYNMIRSVVSNCESLFKQYNFDNKALREYLQKIAELLLNEYDDKSKKAASEEEQKKLSYGFVLGKSKEKLDNNELIDVLAKMFITIIIRLKPDYRGNRKNIIESGDLFLIWIPLASLKDEDYSKLENPTMISEAVVCRYEANDYKGAIKLCEQFYDIDAKDKVKDSGAVSTVNTVYGNIVFHGLIDNSTEYESDALKKLNNEGTGSSNYMLFRYYCGYFSKTVDYDKAVEYLDKAVSFEYLPALVEKARILITKPFIYSKTDLNNHSEQKRITEAEEKIGKVLLNDKCSKDIRSECMYLLGILYEQREEIKESQSKFLEASKLGNSKATEKIKTRDRRTVEEKRVFTYSEHPIGFFINNDLSSLCNYSFARSLPNEWNVYSLKNEITVSGSVQKCSTLFDFLDTIGLNDSNDFFEYDTIPEIIFSFMSNDDEDNLRSTLDLLDLLYNKVSELDEIKRKKLIISINIYVKGKYEKTAMLIDASISNMGTDVFFKVHICDTAKDAADSLIVNAPVFISQIKNDSAETRLMSNTVYAGTEPQRINVVLFGGSETNYSFLIESIATVYMGEKIPVNITIIADNAKDLQTRLYNECPGMYPSSPVRSINFDFLECDISNTNLPLLIYGMDKKRADITNQIIKIFDDLNKKLLSEYEHNNQKKNEIKKFISKYVADADYFAIKEPDLASKLLTDFKKKYRSELTGLIEKDETVEIDRIEDKEEALSKTINAGNYYVVDIGNDSDNLFFAANLRRWLLKSDPKLRHTPFIAMRCTNRKNARLTNNITMDNSESGNEFYNNYNIYCFGTIEDMYSYRTLFSDNHFEKLALKIHAVYSSGPEDSFDIQRDFYSYSYNRDSSQIAALCLVYRLFAAGIYFDDWHDYHKKGINSLEFRKLVADYIEKISDDTCLEYASRIEQSRWNGHLLSRGWAPASLLDVEAYSEYVKNTRHKFSLAKIHPFLRDWENLGDDSDDNDMSGVLAILKEKYGYDKKPRELTINSIKSTKIFLDILQNHSIENEISDDQR